MSKIDTDSQTLAEKYDQVSDYQYRNGLALVEKLGITPEHRVLDLGCGTGRLTLQVASWAGQVTGIDPAPRRIEVARRNLAGAGSPNAAFELGGSSDLGRYGDDSFDIVYLNAVFHWIDDKEDTLDSVYRILKPGGRLGISTGDKDRPFTAKVIAREALRRAGIEDAVPESSSPVSLAELETLLKRAGFKVLELGLKRDPRYFETPARCLEYAEASSTGSFLGHVPAAARERVLADILADLEKHRTPKGIESVYHVLSTIAEKA